MSWKKIGKVWADLFHPAIFKPRDHGKHSAKKPVVSKSGPPIMPMTDSNKALVFLHVSTGDDLPPNWGRTAMDRQIAALAFLCFDGNADRAKESLVLNEIRGFASQHPHP